MSFFSFRFRQPTTSNEEAQRSFECDVCGKVFSTKDYIRSHVQSHAKFAVECEFCGKSFKFRTNMRAHINTEHLNADKRFVCVICGKNFKTKFSLKAHLETHNDSRPFECLVCGKSFKSKTRLKTHSVVQSDRQDFKCEICEKRFKRNGDLKEHLRRHENKREFECKICGKSFKTKWNLNIHRQRIIKQRETSSALNVTNHSKLILSWNCTRSIIHSEIKNFECPECGKVFKRNMGLKLHLVTHSDQRDFKCEICNKEFKVASSFKRHKLTQCNSKTFDCLVCGKSVKYLKQHQLTHLKHQGTLLWSLCLRNQQKRQHKNSWFEPFQRLRKKNLNFVIIKKIKYFLIFWRSNKILLFPYSMDESCEIFEVFEIAQGCMRRVCDWPCEVGGCVVELAGFSRQKCWKMSSGRLMKFSYLDRSASD